ncbi:unnamed protein product, partial [Symbiodinium sp. KB8]
MAGGAVAGARWHSQKKLGATVQHIPGTRNKTLAPWRRPWRVRRTSRRGRAWGPTWRGRRTTLTKTADDGTRKSDWRATLAGDWRALAKPAWWANLAAGTPLALARTTARRTRRKWTARTPART